MIWCKELAFSRHPNFLENHIGNKASVEDLKSLRFALEDALSSLILSAIIENEHLTRVVVLDDARLLQECSFRNYIESFGTTMHDILPEDLLKEGMLDLGKYGLDMGKYGLLSQLSIYQIIKDHQVSLQYWASIHEFYCFRKRLAICEFDKWESVVSGANKNASGWTYCNRQLAYEQNSSLLHDVMKNMGAMSQDDDWNARQVANIKLKMLADINREYFRKLTAEFNWREDNDEDHKRFKAILRNRFLEARRAEFLAKKIHYLPKDYKKSALLSVLSPSFLITRALKVALLVKGEADGKCLRGLTNTLLVNGEAGRKCLSGLANTLLVKGQFGRKSMTGLTNTWARLLVVGLTAASTLTYGMWSKSKKA